MARFVAPNLAGLPPPPALEAIDFEAMRDARLADLAARLEAKDLDEVAAALELESEPLVIAQETGAFYELLIRQRVNEAVRACMLATAAGDDLAHIAATFYGVARLLVTPADPEAEPPTEAVYEDDETFRARALLSLEARSTAGPEGGYIYFALQASGDVRDAACFGEEDAAKYADDSDVLAPEVLVVVLAQDGEVADAGLLETVLEALNAEEVRPIGDKVTVEAASVIEYQIVGVVRHAPGADPAPLLEAAEARCQAYADARYRIGRKVQRLSVAGSMKVTDAEEIELTHPAADIDPGSKGAAYCTGITLTALAVEDDWREAP